jgi:3-hydroxybutyryl-CoA dehydrogenase
VVSTVVVIGGGTMGAGIAQSLLEVGATVLLVESSAEYAETALGRVREGLARRHRKADDPDAAVARALAGLRVTVGTEPAPDAELVIEAVPEDEALKTRVLTGAESAYPDAVVATNTSSLSVDRMAKSLSRPERFVGMHFFNPVPLSQLVEIVVGSSTAPETTAVARSWTERLGKTAIEVKDSPGFATSRLGVAIGLEAIRMVEEGVASVEDIDRGMVLGYKYPIGPLELSDLVGIDVRLAIAEYLASTLGERFTPPQLMRDMVARGETGKKAGKGFYDWSQR